MHRGGARAGRGDGQEQAVPERPPDLSAARIPVKSSAAATGVPNSAPTVDAPARSIASWAGTPGISRAKIATTIAELMAMIGFSGPRLDTPGESQERDERQARQDFSGSGGPMSSVVTLSGPP